MHPALAPRLSARDKTRKKSQALRMTPPWASVAAVGLYVPLTSATVPVGAGLPLMATVTVIACTVEMLEADKVRLMAGAPLVTASV